MNRYVNSTPGHNNNSKHREREGVLLYRVMYVSLATHDGTVIALCVCVCV